jgi:hypothetical protein
MHISPDGTAQLCSKCRPGLVPVSSREPGRSGAWSVIFPGHPDWALESWRLRKAQSEGRL